MEKKVWRSLTQTNFLILELNKNARSNKEYYHEQTFIPASLEIL